MKTISWQVVVFTKLIIAFLIKGNNNAFDLIIVTVYSALNVNVKPLTEAVAQTRSVKKLLLEISQNSQENTWARVSILIKLQKENLAQVLSCEFCEISKNTFSYRTPPEAASALRQMESDKREKL